MPDTYSDVEARIQEALSTIPDGAKPDVRRLSQLCNVPYTRLRERSKLRPSRVSRPAPNRKLNAEQEARLCNYLSGLDSIGTSATWSKLVEDAANSILAQYNTDYQTPPPKVGQQWSRRWIKAHSQYFVDAQYRSGSSFPSPPPSATIDGRQQQEREDEDEEEEDEEEEEREGERYQEEAEMEQEEQQEQQEEQPRQEVTEHGEGRPANESQARVNNYYISSVKEFEAALSSYLYPPPEIPAYSTCNISFWSGTSFIVSIPAAVSQPSPGPPGYQPAIVGYNGVGATQFHTTNTFHHPATAPNGSGSSPPAVKRSMTISEAMAFDPSTDQRWNRKKQRAMARAIVDAAQRVDGYRYTFRNDWNSAQYPGAWRFSYVCNDSLANKDRVANRKPDAAGQRGAKPVFDCRGGVVVKFSGPKQSIEFTYKHNPIHKRWEAEEPPQRQELANRPEPRKRKRRHWTAVEEAEAWPGAIKLFAESDKSRMGLRSPLETAQSDPDTPPHMQLSSSDLLPNGHFPQGGAYDNNRASRITARNSLLEAYLERTRKNSYSEFWQQQTRPSQPLPTAEATPQQHVINLEDKDLPSDPQAQLRELIKAKAELKKLRTENDSLKARLADAEKRNRELRQVQPLRTFLSSNAG